MTQTFRYDRLLRAGALQVLCSFLFVLPAAADHVVFVPGVGWEGQGADVVVTNVDADPRPDMILMAYDAPAQANNFRYRVGLNLDGNGVASSWLPGYVTTDGVGWEGQGAGAAVVNLDADSRPELILMAYDNPDRANNFRYRIGWNLGANGQPQSWRPGFVMVDGVGWEGQGADVLVTSLDSNPLPEMILMAYDNPAQANDFRYRIGWNLNANGVASQWQPGFTPVTGLGWEGQGAGLAVHNLDADPRPEIVLMAYDNPDRANDFRYRVLHNRTFFQGVDLEVDKLNGVGWLPATATRNGVTDSMPSIYRRMGVDVRVVQDRGDLADLHAGSCYTDAELAGLLSAQMNRPPADPNRWHMYGVLVTCHVDGILGIMFDTGERRGFAEFMNAFTSDDRRLRTAAHELGHALCLYHSDGDAWRASGPVSGTGRTVMNQTGVLAADWGYGWSAASLHLGYERSKARWRPRSGFDFYNCK